MAFVTPVDFGVHRSGNQPQGSGKNGCSMLLLVQQQDSTESSPGRAPSGNSEHRRRGRVALVIVRDTGGRLRALASWPSGCRRCHSLPVCGPWQRPCPPGGHFPGRHGWARPSSALRAAVASQRAGSALDRGTQPGRTRFLPSDRPQGIHCGLRWQSSWRMNVSPAPALESTLGSDAILQSSRDLDTKLVFGPRR